LMFVLPATRLIAGGSTEGASWVPVNAAGRRYYDGFELLVLLLVAAVVVLTALTLKAMGRSTWMMLLALAVVASSPLLIGQVLTERFDVWPAALTAAAIAAAARGRHRLGGAMLGLGAATKIYPALLLPVLVIVAVRQRGVREAIYVAGAAVCAAAAVFLPFAIASFSGTWASCCFFPPAVRASRASLTYTSLTPRSPTDSGSQVESCGATCTRRSAPRSRPLAAIASRE